MHLVIPIRLRVSNTHAEINQLCGGGEAAYRHEWKQKHDHNLTFPCRASTVAVCLTLPTCTVTWKPLWKVLAWNSSMISASNIQQIVGFISGLTITIPLK